MSIEFIFAGEEHLSRIDVLSREVWGYAMSPEHLRWRYFNNPAGKAAITLAIDPQRDKIAGFYGAIPTPMQLGGAKVMGAQVIDTMVHPDFQGKGLFGQMGDHCFAQMAKQGIEILYGFPNKNAYHGCIHRLNWHHTGQLALWVRPLKWGGNYLPGCQSNAQVLRNMPEASALDALLQQTRCADKHCRIARSGAWLQWRYDARGVRHIDMDKGQRGYHWHALYGNDGALEAVCVWGRLSCNDASLCEWHGTNESAKKAVLSDAIAMAHTENCRLFRAYGHTVQPRNMLMKHAFAPLPKTLCPPLIIRHLTAQNNGSGIHLHSQWKLLGGDMDTQ